MEASIEGNFVLFIWNPLPYVSRVKTVSLLLSQLSRHTQSQNNILSALNQSVKKNTFFFDHDSAYIRYGLGLGGGLYNI